MEPSSLYPKTWNDLNRKQLLEIVTAFYSDLNAYTKKVLFVKALLQVKLSSLLAMGAESVARCGYITDFLFKDLALTKNLLPCLRIRYLIRCNIFGYRGILWWGKVYGPDDNFNNLCFLEFIFADTYYFKYSGKKEVAHLDKMLACLYRPRRKDYDPHSPGYRGDIREDYNEHLVSGRVKFFESLPLPTKLAVLWWFMGCRNQLEKRYPYAFSKENQKKASSAGWPEVLISLAGDKFGDLTQTGRENVHTVFLHMNATIKAQKEWEEKNG